MSRRNIKKFSWGYEFVRQLGINYHRLYYRKLKLVNREKIPGKKPVIFAINHQNALMDAVSLVFTIGRQIVFMARADIFRKKTTAAILYFLKILPAYRIRDGFHSVDQNKEVFKEVISAMEHNRPVAILPEGNHYGEKRLRPLKKGAARLALFSEEANDFNLGVTIVPVGLDYSNYYHAGSDLLIIFGDPIYTADYREQYLQNPVQAVNNLTSDLAAAMKKVMISIDSEKHYNTISDAIGIYYPLELKKQKLKPTLLNTFKVKRELAGKLVAGINENEIRINDLKEDLGAYHKKLKKFRIRDRQVSNSSINSAYLILKSILSLLLLPVHLYGMVVNYLPYGLPVYLARNIKDRHFISSVRFTAGFLFFTIWYFLLIILAFIIFNHVLLSLAFIISLPLTGILAFYNYRHFRKLQAEFRWLRLKYRDRKEYDGLIGLRRAIVEKVEGLV